MQIIRVMTSCVTGAIIATAGLAIGAFTVQTMNQRQHPQVNVDLKSSIPITTPSTAGDLKSSIPITTPTAIDSTAVSTTTAKK